uniref:Uncharacterized protein n=1 Tax=Glossina austeni TaxID=7395 RepID=A0A1A9VER8_GLOAU
MVKIADSVFSPLFKEFSDLWNSNRGNNLCKVVCAKLADRLTKEIRDLVSAEDVVEKIYAVRHSLRRLDRRRGGQTRMGHYTWYAGKLGLAWAINTHSEDEERFLGRDLGENQMTGAMVVRGGGKNQDAEARETT